MSNLLRQPLVHFCLLGGLFYAAVTWLGPAAGEEDSTIAVNRTVLLTFIQQRTQIFEPDYAAAKLDEMSAEERALLVRDYVEEEALYREAVRLGLDQADYVIRRRMVQKMDYAASSAGEEATLSDAQVEAYYAANNAAYETPNTYSFDQIYVPDPAQAAQVRDALKTQDPAQLGARFAYGRTFTKLTQSETADIFGSGFVEAIMDIAVDVSAWQGPIASIHGVHFVRLRGRLAAGIPPLDAVRKAVQADMRYEAETAARRAALDDIVKSYSVRDEL